MNLGRTLGLLTVFSAAFACGGSTDSGGDDSSQGGAGGAPPSGADACEAYRQAYCRYTTECGLIVATEAECLADAANIVCRAGRLPADCVDAFASNSCVDTPANCDLVAVADPTEAQAACEDFSDAVCTLEESCSGLPYEQCRLDFGQGLPCELVFAVDRDPTECLEAVRASTCDTTPGTECDGLFVLL